MHRTFEDLFRTDKPARDKYLSRLFGLFSEEVVRYWCACSPADYEDLGRPTLRLPSQQRGHTLDFTFRHRCTGRVYVGELKCELEFENYRYLRLTDTSQLEHHRSPAFQTLLQAAREPEAFQVKVNGRPLRVDGAILVWGATTPAGSAAVRAAYGFADVFSVESMLDDLRRWAPASWRERVAELREWSMSLFNYLS